MSALYLVELHNLSLQTLQFLLIFLGNGEDIVSGGASVFQFPLVVLHLGLEEEMDEEEWS